MYNIRFHTMLDIMLCIGRLGKVGFRPSVYGLWLGNMEGCLGRGINCASFPTFG